MDRKTRGAHSAPSQRGRVAEQTRKDENEVRQGFCDAARNLRAWKQQQFEDGNYVLRLATRRYDEGAGRAGDDDKGYPPDRN